MAQLDLAGDKLFAIMQNQNITWLHPPHPTWKMKPPTLAQWLLKGGWRKRDYDERFVEMLSAVLAAFPGSLLTCNEPPVGLPQSFEPAEVKAPSWREAQSGGYVRKLDAQRAWHVPASTTGAELAPFLGAGAWALWKPTDKERGGMPRLLAQDTYKTVKEYGWVYLLSSWWDNEYTELALNPDVAQGD
jgi:hypothetical protein